MSTRLFGFFAMAAVTAASVGCTLVAEERRPAYYEGRRDVIVEQPRYRDPVVVERDPRPVYVEPRPTYVEPRPTYVEPRRDVIVVREAPPPLRVENRGRAPGRDYIWVDGYWGRDHDRWNWVGGHWDRPPHPGAHWEPNRWDHHGDTFELHIGGWH